MKRNKILVATELDELSAKITKFAVNLSAQMGESEVILLNIILPVNPQTFTITGETTIQSTQDISVINDELMKKHRLLAAEEATRLSTKRVKIRPVVSFNDSKTDLNSYINYYNAGLVVFGSRDEQSFFNQIFGSDSEKLVRKVDYPSIILKDEAGYSDIKKILVAIDVNEKDQSGLKDIEHFAKSINAKMQLLHVIIDERTAPDEAIEKLNNLAKDFELANYSINVVNSDNLEDGIKGFVRKNNTDMIAALSQGKGKIKNLIFGSSTQDIIKEIDKPVFVSKIN
ncbi:MAG: universal stress protein [Perlabentimonas sp.]